jgi:GGDEF domain-containing protein
MPMFPALTFRRASVLPERVRAALPKRFEAVAEALAAHADVVGACSVVGRDVVGDGAALAEALADLRWTYRLVRGTAPAVDAVEALSVAWSEATLQYLHDLSCEDPLTGLASLAHVRSRLDEIYRDAELSDVAVARSHALVLVELGHRGRSDLQEQPFARAMLLAQVAEAMRAVFCGGETLGRLGPDRAVALVCRSRDLGVSVGLLRDLLADLDVEDADVRVWVEGLPADADATGGLLDELAR